MTDEELMKRLRERPCRLGFETEAEATLRRHMDREVAADRIKALSGDLKSVLAREAATQERHDLKMEALEAKLAKAVSALRYVVSAKGLTDPTEYGYEAIKHARIALAEIKGE